MYLPLSYIENFGRNTVMGSFSKKKEKNVKDSLQPTNFYSPLGALTYGKGGATYTPYETPEQAQARQTTDVKIGEVLNQFPTQFDVNAAFNNPFYQSTLNLIRRPIESQRTQEEKELTNRLSAQNQLGSSYDALIRDQFSRRYNELNQDADDRARGASFDAYNQSLQNSVSALGALRNDRTAGVETTYSALKPALEVQSAISPLNQVLANFYAKQRSPYEGALGKVNQTANTLMSLSDVFRRFYGR
jgi:hypothetical protein